MVVPGIFRAQFEPVNLVEGPQRLWANHNVLGGTVYLDPFQAADVSKGDTVWAAIPQVVVLLLFGIWFMQGS